MSDLLALCMNVKLGLRGRAAILRAIAKHDVPE
jgi:hypothetical protein